MANEAFALWLHISAVSLSPWAAEMSDKRLKKLLSSHAAPQEAFASFRALSDRTSELLLATSSGSRFRQTGKMRKCGVVWFL